MSRTGVGVVIAAGGAGRRMGGTLPKQFLRVSGHTILERTVALFDRHPRVREIVVVVPAAYLERVARAIRKGNLRKARRVVAGGRDRQESVWNGLNAFRDPPELVLVHDAVRPLVRRRVIDAVIASARRHGATAVGVKVKETVKSEGKAGFFTKTLDREKLWLIQTPQGFDFDLLYRANQRARASGFSGTDDASLVERLGKSVRIVEGDYENIKITTREDLGFAKMLVKKLEKGKRKGKL